MNLSRSIHDDPARYRLRKGTHKNMCKNNAQIKNLQEKYIPNDAYLEKLQNDINFKIKLFEKYLIDKRQHKVEPVLGTALGMLQEGYLNYTKGNFKKASINYMMALTIILSYNPHAETDRMFGSKDFHNKQPGLIFASVDPDTLLSYGNLLQPTPKPIFFKRKERRKMKKASNSQKKKQIKKLKSTQKKNKAKIEKIKKWKKKRNTVNGTQRLNTGTQRLNTGTQRLNTGTQRLNTI